jgi:hypothetical protein
MPMRFLKRWETVVLCALFFAGGLLLGLLIGMNVF